MTTSFRFIIKIDGRKHWIITELLLAVDCPKIQTNITSFLPQNSKNERLLRIDRKITKHYQLLHS